MREFHFPIETQNARKVFGDALNLDPIVTVYDYHFQEYIHDLAKHSFDLWPFCYAG